MKSDTNQTITIKLKDGKIKNAYWKDKISEKEIPLDINSLLKYLIEVIDKPEKYSDMIIILDKNKKLTKYYR